MNRLTSGFAIGTLALFTATGFALAQAASDAAASGSPSAASAPAETAAPSESPAPPPAAQTAPTDRPAQAGGMHNTSDIQSNGKKPCEPTDAQSSSTDAATAKTNCRKPK